MAALNIPAMLGGQARWWVWHKENLCTNQTGYAWFAGPFNTEADAKRFRDKLLSPLSCPGCGRGTPNAGDYNIGQM